MPAAHASRPVKWIKQDLQVAWRLYKECENGKAEAGQGGWGPGRGLGTRDGGGGVARRGEGKKFDTIKAVAVIAVSAVQTFPAVLVVLQMSINLWCYDCQASS